MKSKSRIRYALGCALILILQSLTARSTFAQQPASVAARTLMREHAPAGAATQASPKPTPPAQHASTASIAPARAPNHAGAGAATSSSEPSAIAEHARGHARGPSHSPADGARTALQQPVSKATIASEHATTAKLASAAPHAHENAALDAKSEGVRAEGASATERAGVVNLNTATTAELERLPRIGPARAQAIVDLRTRLTRFSKVEQLLRVKGIGRATFRKLRPMLALEGPTTLLR